jgi:hypothetical protein
MLSRAPAPHHAVDPVAMEIGGPPPAARLDPVRQHLDHRIEILATERCVWRRSPEEIEEGILGPCISRCGRYDLLGEDVERRHGRLDGVELAGEHPAQEGRALH